MNNLPIAHGMNLIQILAMIGNQAVYIESLSLQLKMVTEQLAAILEKQKEKELNG